MLLHSEFFRTLILMGVIQGGIISVMLFFSARRRPANRWLGLLITLISMASLNLYMMDEKWIESSTVLRYLSYILPMVIAMPIGPLIYFYTRSFLDPGFRMTMRDRRHFWPVVLDLVPYATALIYLVGARAGWIRSGPRGWGNFIDTYNVWVDLPRWGSMGVYCWISGRYMRKVPGAVGLEWVRRFLLGFRIFFLIWLVFLVPYLIPATREALLDRVDWYPVYLPLTVLIYWLGIKGYLAAAHGPVCEGDDVDVVMTGEDVGDVRAAEDIRGVRAAEDVGDVRAAEDIDDVGPGRKMREGMSVTPGQRSLAPDVIDRAIGLLRRAMQEQRVYLDPSCNLGVMARHTGLPPKTISAVLNQHLHKNFNDFLNEYRVEAFKEKIRQPQMERLTIAGVAMECGFNSQATFQRSFRQMTGLSPTGFLEKERKDEGAKGI